MDARHAGNIFGSQDPQDAAVTSDPFGYNKEPAQASVPCATTAPKAKSEASFGLPEEAAQLPAKVRKGTGFVPKSDLEVDEQAQQQLRQLKEELQVAEASLERERAKLQDVERELAAERASSQEAQQQLRQLKEELQVAKEQAVQQAEKTQSEFREHVKAVQIEVERLNGFLQKAERGFERKNAASDADLSPPAPYEPAPGKAAAQPRASNQQQNPSVPPPPPFATHCNGASNQQQNPYIGFGRLIRAVISPEQKGSFRRSPPGAPGVAVHFPNQSRCNGSLEEVEAELKEFHDDSTREIQEMIADPQQRLASIFHFFDEDRDGFLSHEELSELWSATKKEENDELTLPLFQGACAQAGADPKRGLDMEALARLYMAGFADLEEHFHVLEEMGLGAPVDRTVVAVVDAPMMIPPSMPAPYEPAPGSLEMPSMGSKRHYVGDCRPCAFLHAAKGCRNGAMCFFCHLCDRGEKKRREKATKAAFRAPNARQARAQKEARHREEDEQRRREDEQRRREEEDAPARNPPREMEPEWLYVTYIEIVDC